MAPISEANRRLLLSSNSLMTLNIMRKIEKKRDKKHTIYRDRFHFGEFHHLYYQLRSDENAFRQYTRMTPDTFDYILDAIRESCYHCATNFQKPITVEERLLLTLR